MSARPFAVRAYAALLRLLPDGLRTSHGLDAADAFADLYRDARQTGGRTAAARFWLRSVRMLIACAWSTRREAKRETGPAARIGAGDVLRDARYGLRALAATPLFSVAAVLILGAGIGATTTIFTVVDTVVLRQMPYPDAGRLVHFDEGSHTYPSFIAWRELGSFEAVVAARDQQVDLVGHGAPARLPAAEVSAEFFRTLGAAPAVGRLLAPDDFTGAAVTVLGHEAWTRLFGRDPSVVGQTVSLNGAPTTVVGVLSAGFSPPEIETGSQVDFWLPLIERPELVNEHSFWMLGVLGRLAPGVSMETAQAEVDAQRAEAARTWPDAYAHSDGRPLEVPLVALREATVGAVSARLYLLLGAVGLMLLIACANVASLVLARGLSRTRELALRKALGASSGRLVTLVLTESVLLALVGGALGVALTYGGVALFSDLNPGGVPRIDALQVDTRVLAFALLVSTATGLLFGLLPALQARRARTGDALKEGALSVTAGRKGLRTRQGLVVAEIALALVLLSGAGLLVRSFVNIVTVDPGFQTEALAVIPLSIDAGRTPAARAQFVSDLLDALQAAPGVDAAAAGWTVPFRETGASRCCWRTRLAGDPALVNPERPYLSMIHPVTSGYFAALGAPLSGGREFTDADADREVAILNETASIGLFGTPQSVGRTLQIGDRPFTVVGVERGVRHWGLDQNVEPAVYVPYARFGREFGNLVVIARTPLTAAAMADLIRTVTGRLDPTLPVGEVASMRGWIDRSVAGPRFLAALFGVFAGVALLLATAGIYGAMAYTVGQRQREMGIRMALGADSGRVLRLVLRHGLATAGLGIGVGLLAATASSRLLSSLIWGVEPGDPLTLATVAAILGAATLAACLVPAWRAGRTDPLRALKA